MKENKMKQCVKLCTDMKVKMWRPLVAMMFLGSVLTGCTDSNDVPDGPGQETATGDDISDKTPFKVEQISVNDNGNSTKTVSVRYYEDMPNVAYIGVSDFQSILMPSKSVRVSKTAASKYALVTSKGETATVNTAEEVMIYDDYLAFVDLSFIDSQGYVWNSEDEESTFIRARPTVYTPATAPVTFNLKKYSIDLRGDGKMVYVPLTTLSDIYSGLSGKHVMFNGEKIILTDFSDKPAKIDAEFFRKVYERTERPADLAAFSYNEMCFAIDYFFGRPGRLAIEKTIDEKGLDQALDDTVRKLLKSTKMNEYIFGLECLGVKLDDGGHTNISPVGNLVTVGIQNEAILFAYINRFIRAFLAEYPSQASAAYNFIMKDDGNEYASKVRSKRFKTDHYVKIGNSVYCFYDDFGPVDEDRWEAYYKGTGPMPKFNQDYKGDITGIIEALDVAAADPEVKNFVLDLTCNNGGDAGVLTAITNLLAGKSSYSYENVLTKQRTTETYQIDGNFDRVFDDRDNAPRHPKLNIAILTSHYAFSCGNLLPSLMKDYGYLIIGEKTGGGSCSIQSMCTAEGLVYQISSARLRLFNQAGQNIDGGIEPHIALQSKEAEGVDEDNEKVKYSDFSSFYDPSIGDQIVKWYADKK